MKSHKDLNVWNMSLDLATQVYKITDIYPKSEMYGITSQMRRATISISSNIAEGYSRGSEKEIVHFLYISLGSASELDTQVILSKRLGFIDEETFKDLSNNITIVRKMLNSLIASVKKKVDDQTPNN